MSRRTSVPQSSITFSSSHPTSIRTPFDNKNLELTLCPLQHHKRQDMGLKGFVEGGIASIIAGCSTHPLDLIKVRMQLHGESASVATATNIRPSLTLPSPAVGSMSLAAPPHRTSTIAVGAQIIRSEGAAALFSGVSATFLRQTLYSATRMGIYDALKTSWSGGGNGYLPIHQKIAAGFIAGGIGAAVGNPSDLAMIRMQADGHLPLSQRRNYTGVGDAIRRMVASEGIGSLWRGSFLTVTRAMIVTASQLATYDEAKEAIMARGGCDGLVTHMTASLVAGVVASVAVNPVGVVRTRVMNMRIEPGAAAPYAGGVDCAVKTVRAEGIMALYKGFVPTLLRQGVSTVMLFVTLEQVRQLLKDF